MVGMNGLATIIVPCFNVEGTLARCLESIAAQTHRAIEVLCVNDGSTDGTLAVMEEVAAHDERFRVIDKPNSGYGASCNRGLDEASGEWTAIVEPDDTIRPTMLEAMLAFAEETAADSDAMIDLVKTPYWTVLPSSGKGDDGGDDGNGCGGSDRDGSDRSERMISCRYFGRVHPGSQPFRIEAAPRLLKHRPSIWSALYRTAFLREHGIRFVEAPGAGWTDNPFLYDTLLRARAIAYLDEAFYEYREEEPKKTITFAHDHPDQVISRLNEMADIIDELAVKDAGILGAHAKRTVNYLRILADAHDLGDGVPHAPSEVLPAMAEVARRLDSTIVFAEPELPLRNKRLFANLIGVAMPRISPLPRLRARAAEAAWALRHMR